MNARIAFWIPSRRRSFFNFRDTADPFFESVTRTKKPLYISVQKTFFIKSNRFTQKKNPSSLLSAIMSHSMNEFPLDKQYLEVPSTTKKYEQILMLYVPTRELLRSNALTFKDFKQTTEEERLIAAAWTVYYSVFWQTANRAVEIGGAECDVYLEEVVHKDFKSQETIGYQWVIGYNRPPPPPPKEGAPPPEPLPRHDLDNVVYDIIGHYRRTLRASQGVDLDEPMTDASSKENSSIAPTKSKRHLSSTSVGDMGEAWRRVPSYEVWCDIVSVATGFEHELRGRGNKPNLAVSMWDYSPALAFACRQDDVCPAQSIDNLFGQVGSPNRGYIERNYLASGSRICWPDKRRVLLVRKDLCHPSTLIHMMMPHCQKIHAETKHQLEILLPKLVSKTAQTFDANWKESNGPAFPRRIYQDGVEDDDEYRERNEDSNAGDVEILSDENTVDLVEQERRRFEQKRHVLLDNDEGIAQRCANKRQRLSHIKGAYRMIAGPEASLAPTTLAEAQRNATPFHSISNATKRVNSILVKSVVPFDVRLARSIRLINQAAAQCSYEIQLLYSPLMSNAMKAVLEAINNDGLFDLTPEKRNFFRRPADHELQLADPGLSPFGCYHRKFLQGMEFVKHINHLHSFCIMALTCAHDAMRYALGLHLHLFLMTLTGGLGKSMIWDIATYLLITGTVSTPTYRTGASGTGTDENGNINANADAVVIMDEVGAGSMKGKRGESGQELARLKFELSNGFIQVTSMSFDDNGRRITTDQFIVRSGVIMCSSNGVDMDEALARRFYKPKMPEGAKHWRYAADTMNQASIDPKGMSAVDRLMQGVHHTLHGIIAHTEKMIQSGILPEPSDDICGIMSLLLTQALRKNKFYVEPNITVFKRLFLFARRNCINRCIIEAFMRPDSPSGTKTMKPIIEHLTLDDIRKELEGRLFVTLEDYIHAVGTVAEELMDSLELAIRSAIQLIFDQRREQNLKHENIFWVERKSIIDPDQIGGMRSDPQINYNYIAFDRSELIAQIHGMIPSLMNDFSTNLVVIAKYLDRFTERHVRSRKFGYFKNAAGVFEVCEASAGRVEQSPAARHVDRTYLVHCAFLISEDAVRGQALDDNARRACTPTAAFLKHALQDALSVKCMIRRRLVFAPRNDRSSDIFSFEINAPPCQLEDEDLDAFQTRLEAWLNRPAHIAIKLPTFANTDTFKLFPELKEMIPDHSRLASEDLIIDVDLDTFALQEHNKKLFLTPEPISKDFRQVLNFQEPQMEMFLRRLGEQAGRHTIPEDDNADDAASAWVDDVETRELEAFKRWQVTSTGLPPMNATTPCGPHFAGVPIQRVSPDHYERWVETQLDKIIDKLKTGSASILQDDVDFDPEEFIYTRQKKAPERRDGETEKHYRKRLRHFLRNPAFIEPGKKKHWIEFAKAFKKDAPLFGYEKWADAEEDEEALARQYKMIRYHPVVTEHLRKEIGV